MPPTPYYLAYIHGILCRININLNDHYQANTHYGVASTMLRGRDPDEFQGPLMAGWNETVEFVEECGRMMEHHHASTRPAAGILSNVGGEALVSPTGPVDRYSRFEAKPTGEKKYGMPVYEDPPEGRDPHAEEGWYE
ncbi:hypothetical protein QFC21_007297 [Naganishia friedmannii]|uniref:Uncharacterized protein n=1 Tax=Naganishia friedmannii TaxID=89922 RepID=A0ACC2UW43_9TREE|nr:hypothetical protein QFC21_007297 [Naganishia friedmannii]